MSPIPPALVDHGSDNGEDRLLSVCFAVQSLNIGGAERQLLQLARGLRAKGLHVALVTLKSPGVLSEEARASGIECVSLGTGVKRFWRFRKLVGGGQFDVVYSFMPSASVFCSLALVAMKFPKHVWGVRAADIDLSLYGWKAKAIWSTSRLLSRSADLIIANSQAGARYHSERGYPADRICVVNNGVNTDVFNVDDRSRSATRATLGVNEADFVVGMVARFDPIKGHQRFLEALPSDEDSLSGLHVVLVGGGNEALRAEIASRLGQRLGAGRFTLVGETDEVAGFLRALDVLVIASQSEGFPNVAVEAMACGVPVVGFDVGDLREIVHPPGQIVNSKKPSDLWQAIEEVRQQMDAATSHSQRESILRRFTVDRVVNDTARVLESLIR